MKRFKSVTWEAWANYGPISQKIGAYKTLGEAWAALMNSIVVGQQGIVTDGSTCIPFTKGVSVVNPYSSTNTMPIQQPSPLYFYAGEPS